MDHVPLHRNDILSADIIHPSVAAMVK